MASTTHTVLIDFQADYDSLDSAIDVLINAGKVDAAVAAEFKKANVEIKKQGDEFTNTAKKAQTSTQSFGRLSDMLKQYPKSGINRFLLQVGNDLTAAGVKAKDFYKNLDPKDAVSKQTSLKNELKQVREEMQRVAQASGTMSEEYKKLRARAGELDDTIKDVNSDIANAGSDTRGIDNVVGSISALAGGYSAVQGAAALFGDESEELQKTLLKVNAAMALATGIQQVSNAVQKEGALARVADTVATNGQIVAQRIYAAVVGQSVGALKLLRIAFAATGVGLLVLGVAALINKFGGANNAAKRLTEALADLREENELVIDSIRRSGELAVSGLERQGALSSEISKRRLIDLRQEETQENKTLETVRKKREELLRVQAALPGNSKALKKSLKETEEAIDASENRIRELFVETGVLQNKIAKDQIDERKAANDKAVSDAKEASEKALENAKKLRAREFEDYKARIELKLLTAEKGSEEELKLQKDLLRAKLQIDLEAEGLGIDQRRLLIQQFFKDRIDLEKNFNKAIIAAAIEDQKNRDAAALENLNLTEEERLSVRIEYLQLGAAQEIAAAEGNAAKILAINAKLNSDITAAKVDAIKKQADYEIAFSSAKGGGSRRALETVAANEKLKGEIRINAIRELSQRETEAIDRQIKANRDAAKVQGADQAALALEYEQLLDQKAAKAEETEKKITGIVEDENEKRKASDIAYIQATISGLQQIGDIIAIANSNEQEASDQSIKRRRDEVQDLLEAGAIKEKEARERNRRLDTEERQTKQRAAQQQKNLAVFQAALAIPQAFIAGLTAPFPIGGPIYGAILAGIAATQAAIVASRPIPKFATGKKGSYSGPGVVGEAGAELIQRADGSMEVATRRSMVYLGARDKVFTAAETKNILPFVNKEAMAPGSKSESFDYEKLAKAVKQKQGAGTVVNIDKEFISESVANGLSRVNYFDRYYNSKG